MSYVVASKVKEFINAKGMMTAGDLVDHLNKKVGMWLDLGVKAAKANDRKTVRGSDLLAFGAGKMPFAVASKVKEHVNGADMMASGELPDNVSSLIEWMLGDACARCSANGRKTVRGEDL